MQFLMYIGNVITGRFAHWNATNNDVIAEMWERSSGFPYPIRIAFQEFIGSSTALVNALLGPDKGASRLIKKDPVKITRQQFVRIHGVILDSLAGTFAKLNPSFSEPFKGALSILHGQNPDTSRIMKLIDESNQPELTAIGCAAWEEIVGAAGSSEGTTALDAIPFTALLGAVASDSFKDINDKLKLAAR